MDMTPEFAAAFVKMQGELPTVTKDRMGQEGKQKYKYADLASIMEVAVPVMQRHGFGIIHKPIVRIEDGVTVAGVRADLIHDSGHVESCEFVMPVVKEYGTLAKTVGSIITYSRRYSLAILGICTEDDDDNAPGVGSSARGAHEVANAGKKSSPRETKPKAMSKSNREKLKSAAADRLTELDDDKATIEELIDTAASKLGYASRVELVDSDIDKAMEEIKTATGIPF